MINIYNIKMVSMLLDVPTVTIRAWENRYGVIEPRRDDNGHRIYSDQDVEDLRWLIDQTKHHGLSIKHAAKLLDDKRKEVEVANVQPAAAPPIFSHDEQLKESLYSVLLDVNVAEANRMIDVGFSMYDFDYMLHHVLVPTLIRIGDEWEEGKISVAQEHFSTELIKQRLFQFMRVFQHNPLYPKMIAACPANERHEVGLLVFTLFLRRKGVEIVYLGADTPLEGLIEIQNRLSIDYILLSSTDQRKLEQHVEYIRQLHANNADTRIIIGGTGFEHFCHAELPVISLNGDIHQWDEWFNSAFPLQRL